MQVKICGLTNAEDALCAAEAGANLLGFVLAESPRKVEPTEVYCILNELERHNLRRSIEAVGVFVNASTELIEKICRETGLDTAQLHGDENPAWSASLTVRWYKAVRIMSKEDVDKLFPLWGQSFRLLADARSTKAYGGTGLRIPRRVLQYAAQTAHQAGSSFFAAGGITADNVVEIVHAVRPDGIDVSGGVEERPGKKSPDKINKLFAEIGKTL